MKRYRLTAKGAFDVMVGEVQLPFVGLIESEDGAWCWHKDVAALESQLQEAQARVKELEVHVKIISESWVADRIKQLEAENAALRAVKGLAVKLLDSVDVENEITWALLDALTAAKGVD